MVGEGCPLSLGLNPSCTFFQSVFPSPLKPLSNAHSQIGGNRPEAWTPLNSPGLLSSW